MAINILKKKKKKKEPCLTAVPQKVNTRNYKKESATLVLKMSCLKELKS